MIKTVYKQTLMSHVVNVSVLAACMWRKRPSFFFFFCRCVYSCVFDTGGLQQQIHDEFQTLLSVCVCRCISYFRTCLGSQRPALSVSVKI